MDLGRVFKENLKYTGHVGERNWMDSSEVGLIAAELYNIVVYGY